MLESIYQGVIRAKASAAMMTAAPRMGRRRERRYRVALRAGSRAMWL